MSDYWSDAAQELRHDGWQYVEPPSQTQQERIDREASAAAGVALYVLVKADGTRSGANTYSAISRLAGHFRGSRIEPA